MPNKKTKQTPKREKHESPFVIGEGATIQHWSDRSAGTVIDISKSGKVITVQEDDWERTDNNGMSEAQEYKYTKNTNNRAWKFSLRKTGRYTEVGQTAPFLSMRIGRNKYHDFSF